MSAMIDVVLGVTPIAGVCRRTTSVVEDEPGTGEVALKRGPMAGIPRAAKTTSHWLLDLLLSPREHGQCYKLPTALQLLRRAALFIREGGSAADFPITHFLAESEWPEEIIPNPSIFLVDERSKSCWQL